jgi:predicted dehydrogenase
VVETRKGIIGEIDINQASAVPGHSLQVWGTNGVVSLSSRRGEIQVKHFAPESLAPKELDLSLASRDRKYPTDQIPFREEIVSVDPDLQVDVYADFADAIRSGKPPFVRPHEPLAVMRLIDRCREDSGRVRRMREPFPRAPGRS